jgi:hypothetical protein
MARIPPMNRLWQLVLPDGLYGQLHRHLFPGDHDEHGAVIAAGIAESSRGVRLLGRELHLAVDGVDYVPGKRGYRMLKASFIHDRIITCRDERLVYLAMHNHGGHDHVAFSDDDLRSHERGYPALLDIAKGMPVGALVFAPNAIAGDIWLPDGARVQIESASIVGASLRRLRPAPIPRPTFSGSMYDRQARLFGDAGQALLGSAKIGVVGLGGAGSLVAEYLGRLGVGEFVFADPDRAEISNLPRLTAASRLDAMPWLANPSRPAWMRRIAIHLARSKVALARRNILRANPQARVEAIVGNFLEPEIAAKFVDCGSRHHASSPPVQRYRPSIPHPRRTGRRQGAGRSGLWRCARRIQCRAPHHFRERLFALQQPHKCRETAGRKHFRGGPQAAALCRRAGGSRAECDYA